MALRGLLDDAAKRMLLRKSGSGYIFANRLLLERYAALGPERPETHHLDRIRPQPKNPVAELR